MGNLDIFEGFDVVHAEGENLNLFCLEQDYLQGNKKGKIAKKIIFEKVKVTKPGQEGAKLRCLLGRHP